jgi:hypothetical protein
MVTSNNFDDEDGSIDLFALVSSNKGVSWSAPVRITWPILGYRVNNWFRVHFNSVSGIFAVSYESDSTYGSPVAIVSSSSDGVTWSNISFLNEANVLAGGSEDEWDPSITSIGANGWIAVYHRVPTQQIMYSHSTDLVRWTAPLALGTPRASFTSYANWVPVSATNRTFKVPPRFPAPYLPL